jgi:hypothetical protein
MNKQSNRTVSTNREGIIVLNENQSAHFVSWMRPVEEIQLYGKSFKGRSYQEPDASIVKMATEFNKFQFGLYNKALYGVAYHSKETRARLTSQQVEKIEQRKKEVWKALNRWKNEIMYGSASRWFQRNTKSGSSLRQFLEDFALEPEYRNRQNNMTFEQLGLTRMHIAMKLVELGFLPRNFFELV